MWDIEEIRDESGVDDQDIIEAEDSSHVDWDAIEEWFGDVPDEYVELYGEADYDEDT